jgi:hypothetical protein
VELDLLDLKAQLVALEGLAELELLEAQAELELLEERAALGPLVVLVALAGQEQEGLRIGLLILPMELLMEQIAHHL